MCSSDFNRRGKKAVTLNDNQAHQVAWNSVKNSYEQSENGQWQHKAEGGAGISSTGTMPGA
ncbi:MAG: ChaB family protein [Coleofasciculus sp. C1-SOL-03]|uniref:ChaB family protein n=1 Tax=Coleofasciculus sp. C1-SOL-03 TaxID=3069522 RepID=UPI0032FC45BD